MINLEEYIRTVPDFPKPGILFKDISPLLANPSAFAKVIHLMAEKWRGVDAIVALDARGFIFGAALARELGTPFIMARKKGKLPGETESLTYALEYGTDTLEIQTDARLLNTNVLIVDDLLATGGTALAACQLVEKRGGTIVGCAFVVELTGLGGRQKLKDYETHSLIVSDDKTNPLEKKQDVVYTGDMIGKTDNGDLVFIERINDPKGLALAGGKREPGETLEQAAAREFFQETGMRVTDLRLLNVYGKPGRDPRGNYISTAFVGRASGTPKSERGKTRVIFARPTDFPELKGRFVFDHAEIVSDYLAQKK